MTSQIPSTLKKLAREPLLQFALVALLLTVAFAVRDRFAARAPTAADDAPTSTSSQASTTSTTTSAQDTAITPLDLKIVVDDAKVTEIVEIHRQKTGTAPDDATRAALIASWVEQEALVREAIRQNLHLRDEAVRTRLQQLMEFVAGANAPVREPTDADLATWLEANRTRFAFPDRVSFTHVSFETARHGAKAKDEATALLARIRNGTIDGSKLGTAYLRRSVEAMAIYFGENFGRTVIALEGDDWQGPIASDKGWHLVRIIERAKTGTPFKTELVEEWKRDAKKRQATGGTGEIVKRFQIDVTARDDAARTAAAKWQAP